MKIIDSVHLVDGTMANVYLVLYNGKIAVIDAGLPGQHEKILKYIEKLGFSPEDVDVIIATHGHHDHVGALKDLKEATGAKVAAHRDEVPYISNPAREGVEPVDVDIKLEDGDVIAGLRIVHSPGHTPGSIVLYAGDLKAIFTGDLVHEENGRLLEIPQKYSMDPMKNREAIRRILDLDFRHVLPSHGRPILDKGKERWRELVEELGL